MPTTPPAPSTSPAEQHAAALGRKAKAWRGVAITQEDVAAALTEAVAALRDAGSHGHADLANSERQRALDLAAWARENQRRYEDEACAAWREADRINPSAAEALL